jgi:glycosyltransferase involved in cell wall biosynthesis
VRAVKAMDFEAVVIDDGSNDNSGEIAREAGALVIRNARKSGKGATLRKGFDYALTEGYGAAVTMDGDGQHAAGDISAFLECARANRPCLIVGNRMAAPQGMPLVRYLTNRFMSALISLGCRQSVPDTQCGYRYIDAEILKELPLQCDGF